MRYGGKALTTMVIGMALAGCSSTTIHVFTQGVAATEVERVRGVLEGKGFDVVTNDLTVPPEIAGPTLMYSPLHDDIRQVDQVAEQLHGLGYNLALQPMSRGNHLYTGANVGVYLDPPDVKDRTTGSLAGREFGGRCPEVDAYLSFTSESRAVVELIGWNEDTPRETVEKHAGLWSRKDDRVSLLFDDHKVDFQLIPIQRSTQYSEVSGIRLMNTGDDLEGCDFHYREHE